MPTEEKCPHGRKIAKSCMMCNPIMYLRAIIYSRIKTALVMKVNGVDKAAILGCTIEDFKTHLESKMKPGMTWENYGREKGKWCIDYITPLGYEITNKVKNKEIIKQRLHYLNTQPMWCVRQWKKGNKYVG